ncbi:magnesium transporter [Kiritimatiella glycovorans]|uniref:Magnesium transporter MgtE n=1 Tax=Kiritimatiella glycovorans TaxID=1307763 RepID=A0A0G3EFB5_9BACT|nr:magnesium transporter [Kiritimatiella glycovorans]AKJ65028.1 Magnesium transporter MgtE [Kiritimatiella glycovorans]
MTDLNRLKQQISFCARGDLWEQVPRFLQDLHPADLAEIIADAPPEAQGPIFEQIDDELKPDVLVELEGAAEENVLRSLSSEEISDFVEDMAPDDAADILGEVEERSQEILELMEEEESGDVRELLQYEEDTAGGIMTTDFVAVRNTITAGEAVEYIASLELDEPFYYAYVVDREDRLVGWVELWDLLKPSNRNKRVVDLVEHDAIPVHVSTDQEEAARVAAKYDLSSLPVLDEENRLVGRITMDDLLDVIQEEASEDLFKFAGSNESELEYDSPLRACRARLPWLLITLATGFLSSVILKHFIAQITTAEVLSLSFFVPIIMAMGGNTGIQSSTLIIRGLAVGTVRNQKILKLLSREIIAGALMGICCGLIIGLWAKLMIDRTVTDAMAFSTFYLSFTVGIALFAAMSFAAVFGALAPILLDRSKADPAVASGPFVTASNDVIALIIYYLVTLLMLAMHG